MEFRKLTNENIADVIAINKNITGEDNSEYLRSHIEEQMLLGENELILGAFEKEQLIGFLLASMRQAAFGQSMKVAYLEMIEIDPALQKSGIGTLLLNEFKKQCKKLGIQRVITLVDWQETLLLNFFHTQGFKKGDMIQLDLNI